MKSLSLAVLLLIASSSLTSAGMNANLNSAIANMCEKLKTCAFQQMGINASSKQTPTATAINNSVNQACALIKADFTSAATTNTQKRKAIACVSSVTKKTCSELSQPNAPSPSACKGFQSFKRAK
ncbi:MULTISPECIES: hypothetical protein [unclassified Pseudovibrio]|uniref:hypothetical protein n=1 Tax=unclassified Pseudovibrio TaxID=2627060 RepID=UPI0007AEC954|nr:MULTISPECIES: hypothetical protein [unclassified Pseudovibrio]KZL22374.1 hypothetical protein PsWM33_03972 [Pseudovibrio sp. WM33]KZL24007.1 hypothetical protein PsAD37_02854 [Pseudovibrio sp. Ad37]